VSHHLKVLHEAGLLDREQRGRWVFYRLRREPLEALRNAFAP
jgi:ArsR family transcriptional regulator